MTTAPPTTAPAPPTPVPAPAVRPAPRTLTIGGTAYPLFLPSIRDPRLHVASVIITVHVLGQVGLGFWVSVPQILAAILTCAVLEVAITFQQSRAFVWPASAMLTGSGVALIMRVVGTPPGQPWFTGYWYVFAVVAGLSLLTKYVIKYRGSHVFNPSNIGLVVAFLVLGSARAEPLDFWWAPLNIWMLAAYAVITLGGLLITRRLHLLPLAAAFWITFALGQGTLAASGHCMVARWSFEPVCGVDYWRNVVFSPEVLIFLFFMITDPKTVPTGQVGRVAFGVLVGVVSTLLMAPQTDEFGTKVALLSGLVVLCAARPLLDRLVPQPKSAADDLRQFARRLRLGAPVGAAAAAIVVLVTGAGIVLAGAPARGFVFASSSEILGRLPTQVDPSTLPAVTIDPKVTDFFPALGGDGMQEIVVTLAQNLELENLAMLHREASILEAVDHGDRLIETKARLDAIGATGLANVVHYRFDAIHATLLVPFGKQDGFSIGLESRGTQVSETVDAAGTVVGRASGPFELTFAVRRATGDRWLNVGVLPSGAATAAPAVPGVPVILPTYTQSGALPAALIVGKLASADGCVTISDSVATYEAIWPAGYSARRQDDAVVIVSPSGEVLGGGGSVALGGGIFEGESAPLVRDHVVNLFPACDREPFWLVASVANP
jgi:Na+-translocating ferredoxin:NAD+ oxidoreductase RnfD subunit